VGFEKIWKVGVGVGVGHFISDSATMLECVALLVELRKMLTTTASYFLVRMVKAGL